MNYIKVLGLFLSIMTLGVFADANICSSGWLGRAGGSDVDAFIRDTGADTNQVCNTVYRNRPVHQALLTTEVDSSVVGALIKNGARINERNAYGETAMDLAEERFARVANLPKSSSLYLREEAIYAAVMGSLETDQFTAAIDAHDKLCDLGWWLSSGSGPAVERLLAVPGVDPNDPCNGNNDRAIQIPLRLTALNSPLLLTSEIHYGIRALVDAGAALTVRNNSGQSALDMAEVRYDRVKLRIIPVQRRWCRDEITDRQFGNEITRNAPDVGAYLYIKSSAIKTQSYDQAHATMMMDLYRVDDNSEGIDYRVLCPARGVSVR